MSKAYKDISIDNYNYPLDENRIAKHPLDKRDSSKLLVYNNKSIFSSTFNSIHEHINSGDLLVFNNTKVVQARLRFTKETGAAIEIFLLNPVKPHDYQLAFSENKETEWDCIVGNIKRWKGGRLCLAPAYNSFVLNAEMQSRTNQGAVVRFSWNNQTLSFAKIIEICGDTPIPPYLNREPISDDKLRYQTIYAKPEGSVAAPTAGLHFTNEVIEVLKVKGVEICETTLHVGAGTFRPVKSTTIGDHEMHTERIYITNKLIDSLLNNQGRVFAVGTTSLRTLESLYWLGVKLINNENESISGLLLEQWEGYLPNPLISVKEALSALKMHISANGSEYIAAKTQMIIVPSYRFKIVDALITNFHQPRSTLLLLVAAFIGEDWKKVYQYALDNDFRFLSYGDSSILFRK